MSSSVHPSPQKSARNASPATPADAQGVPQDLRETPIDTSIYRYVLRHTKVDQIFLLLLTLVTMPFVYVSLEVPKLIVNVIKDAVGGRSEGYALTLLNVQLEQLSYLYFLCFIFLVLIVFNGALKYYVNVYRGVLGERMLRRFRYELYARMLRFPLPHFKRVSSGEIIPMITAETEPLGGFIGDAFALPAFQGGLLLTYLSFIFIQDPWLGLAAVALYPPQLYLIPKLQSKVNALAKQRVATVRKLSDKIGESVSGITEVHAHDTSHYERADISHRLGIIYKIRFELYRRKFFIKFLNNFLAQLTPFFFYSIGGYFVIKGDLSLGAMVAVLVAYKDVLPPWKELLKYYQIKEDVRVKYEQIIEQFQPENMLAVSLQDRDSETKPLTGDITGVGVSYTEDNFVYSVDGANFKFALAKRMAVVGASGSGKNDVARLAGRLSNPSGGRLSLGGESMEHLPQSITGRRIGYVGSEAFVFSGSVRDNLLYALKHRPGASPDYDEHESKEHKARVESSLACGNTTDDLHSDWVDYASAGVSDATQLAARMIEVLDVTALTDDVFELGLSEALDPKSKPQLAVHVLEARRALRDKLRQPEYASLVEPFDVDVYNTNMSVAENLLFGSPVGATVDFDKLHEVPVVAEALAATKLDDDFVRIGRKLAEIMLDIFADVAPDSDLFERFSFISADDLPLFTSIINRFKDDESLRDITSDDRSLLMSLPFKLTVARHRLGLIDEELQARLVDARKSLFAKLGDDNGRIEFFDTKRINPAISLQDNILFGKLVYGQAQARAKVGQLVRDTLGALGVREDIIRAGLEYQTGIAGARLSIPVRRKLSIARCLMKRPDLLIVNGATGGLDPGAEKQLLLQVCEHMQGHGVIWVLDRPQLAAHFEEVMVMNRGRVEARGASDELSDNAVYQALLSQ